MQQFQFFFLKVCFSTLEWNITDLLKRAKTIRNWKILEMANRKLGIIESPLQNKESKDISIIPIVMYKLECKMAPLLSIPWKGKVGFNSDFCCYKQNRFQCQHILCRFLCPQHGSNQVVTLQNRNGFFFILTVISMYVPCMMQA